MSGLLTFGLLLQLLVPPTVEIPSGSFQMGSDIVALSVEAARSVGDEWRQFDRDEGPVHAVYIDQPFRMGVTEVTNAQYECFDPSHRALRGRDGFSTGDDEAVVFVSWEDATGFCRWLSEKTGQAWRLPTEAEWEYACRAGTTTAYSYGDSLPEGLLKQNYEGFHNDHIFKPVDLTVAQGAGPNAFGFYDMHGNVEEWCLDAYAPYPGGPELLSPSERGCYRVTRGGSHSTDPRFLRSAARSAAIPQDRSYLIGFRVVCEGPAYAEATAPATVCPVSAGSLPRLSSPSCCRPQPDGPCSEKRQDDSTGQRGQGFREHSPEGVASLLPESLGTLPRSTGAVFLPPIPYVLQAPDSVISYHHNHEPSIARCPNGDLLAIWFSCANENGREMVILSARLRSGEEQWDAPQPFFKVPDRNMTGCSLYYDETAGALIHLGGVEASGWWRNLAVAMRKSYDNGYTWTPPVLVAPAHTVGNQLVSGMSRAADGTLIQVCDADPGGVAGSVVHLSRDNGDSWQRQGDPANFNFAEGGTGPNIAGIHAGVVQLKDGRLMAFGRGVKIPDGDGVPRMPVSFSSDMGQTWTYHASGFPPIGSGQRLVLLRLREGPILLVSFDNEPPLVPIEPKKAAVAAPRPRGMFASLSYDEGATWTEPKVLTDRSGLELEGGAWTGRFVLDACHSEPKGYLAATQTPDGIIHLISSKNHYRFNLRWLER